MKRSAERLAEIMAYDSNIITENDHKLWEKEEKRPDQVFLGIRPGSLVSLADKKVFLPTHPEVFDHYNMKTPLADHLR